MKAPLIFVLAVNAWHLPSPRLMGAVPSAKGSQRSETSAFRGRSVADDDCLMAMTERRLLAYASDAKGGGSPEGKRSPEWGLLHSYCGLAGSTQSATEPLSSWEWSSDRFVEQTLSVKYETLGLFALLTAMGVASWDWGSSSFHFENEGWFSEEETGSGGVDKLGHAYSTYLMTEFLNHSIQRRSSDPRGGAVTAGILGFSMMTYVEVFDGLSNDHGFSYEDLIMNALGAGFSTLRNQVPGLREKIDFRFQYLPSPYSSFDPFGDYSGQKYLLAVKLAGFDALKDTPLRYVEIHGGYYARGFSSEEERAGEGHDRELYVGIGLNLSELLFGEGPHRDHWASKAGRGILSYVQVPYTYLSSDGNSGR